VSEFGRVSLGVSVSVFWDGVVENCKHRTLLMLIYSAGLRLNELIKLRVDDIKIDRKEIFIYYGKGKKDRITILADKMIIQLKTYLKEFKPSYWLIEGADGGCYSARSVQATPSQKVCKLI
jgi:site-specific recombinase XerD